MRVVRVRDIVYWVVCHNLRSARRWAEDECAAAGRVTWLYGIDWELVEDRGCVSDWGVSTRTASDAPVRTIRLSCLVKWILVSWWIFRQRSSSCTDPFMVKIRCVGLIIWLNVGVLFLACATKRALLLKNKQWLACGYPSELFLMKHFLSRCKKNKLPIKFDKLMRFLCVCEGRAWSPCRLCRRTTAGCGWRRWTVESR